MAFDVSGLANGVTEIASGFLALGSRRLNASSGVDGATEAATGGAPFDDGGTT